MNYIRAVQFLFKDIELSKDVNSGFKKYLISNNDTLELDFHVQILSSGAWPFKQVCTFAEQANCSYPSKFN